MITQDELKYRLHYDTETGIFKKIADSKNTYKKCKVIGHIKKDRYIGITIDKVAYYAHRLAWLYIYGEFPKEYLDHIDGNRANNSLNNLRESTNAENQQNRAVNKNNKSRYTGVCFCKYNNKWRTEIRSNNKKTNLGYFSTAELASESYKEAKKILHTFNPIQR